MSASKKQKLVSLENFSNNEWRFVYAKELEPIHQQLDKVINDLNEGNQEVAVKLFEKIKNEVPEDIASYVYISLILMDNGVYDQAIAVIEEGLGHVAKLFPEKFFEQQPLLEWSQESNQPFLRCLANLVFALLHLQEFEKALEVCEQMLMLNPTDHQGMRDPLLQCYFELDLIDPALELCQVYADDTMPAIPFGYGLLLYKKGKLAEAKAQMAIACEFFPEVAKELLAEKHTLPTEDEFNNATFAYLYQHDFGKFWQASKGALELLREVSV